MSSMRDRLATALIPYIHHGIATPEEAADAVLAAMREPTEAMKRAFSSARPESPKTVWHEVIDAAIAGG